jgi:uncharacterized protein (DUF885 family)
MIHRKTRFATTWAAVICASAVVPALAAAVTPSADNRLADSRLAAYLDAAYERMLAANPSLATSQGVTDGALRWEDLTERGLAADAARARRELAGVRKIRSDALSPRAHLQQRVFVGQQQLLVERHRWRHHLYPLNQIVGPHVDVPRTLANQPLRSLAELDAWLARLEAVPQHLDGLIERLDLAAARGIHLPKSVYPLLVAQARGIVRDNPVLADFERRLAALALDEPQRLAALAQARATLDGAVNPAYLRLVASLERHAANGAVDGGAWQLPDGDAFYAFLLRQFTTTDLGAEQIHALGLAEVERTHREMRALMQRVGETGELRAFLQRLKADPRFYLTDDDAGRAAYLARARGLVERMQARLPEYFLKPPALPLEIRVTEPYRAAGAPSGFYEAGTADGRRPGVVYLNLQRLDTRPLYDLEALLYHEALPGHHLQISSILVDASIPRLRKVNRWWQDTGFVEGWALYTERLGKEMGFYEDPYSDFGRIAAELWRATRLVVDTGLHSKRWSREQAIRYLDENTPSPRASNESAVDRYLAVPGQATAFTVGMLHILAERERARQALGAEFDLRQFHAVVLENGYVPLWALSEAIDGWIAQAKAD